MSNSKPLIQTVSRIRSILGESPVWDPVKQRIIWVDIVQGKVHEFYPGTNKSNTFNVGQMVGAVAVANSGNLVASLQNGFAKIDINQGTVEIINDPENHLPDNRFNDGKCDPAGRFWAGTMSLKGASACGTLYAIEKDGSVSPKVKGVGCSNGIVWSRDEKTMYFIDTPTRNVFAYDYDVTTGNISNSKTVIAIDEKDGHPDGMTIDAEGMLWIALWNGWKIQQWNPLTSTLLNEIYFPVAKITSCTFGGDQLDDLYITTASKDLTHQERKDQPLAGCLLVIKQCGYKGLAPFTFADIAF